jgi:predicted transcriptional regulator
MSPEMLIYTIFTSLIRHAVISELQILRCLSDEKCAEMLSSIHQNKLISPAYLNLTRKQYYARLHNLMICGLVRKHAGQYRLSSFGKVVFDWYLVLKETISKEYWKLRMVDTLGSSGIPEPELDKMLNTLIGNEKIRQILRT